METVPLALGMDRSDAADLASGDQRVHVSGAIEQRRLLSEYLPTGELRRVIQRRAGSPDVVRWLRYDSLGRLVLNVEPNTSVGFNPNPSADAATVNAWRYAYNDAGERRPQPGFRMVRIDEGFATASLPSESISLAQWTVRAAGTGPGSSTPP